MTGTEPGFKPLQFFIEDKPVAVGDKAALDKIYKEVSSYGVTPAGEFNPFEHNAVVKCFEAAESKGTIICVFNSQKVMNEVLLRTDMFVEETDEVYFKKEEFFSTAPLDRDNVTRKSTEYYRGNTPEYAGIRGYDLPGAKINKFLDLSDQDATAAEEGHARLQAYFKMEERFLAFIKTLREKYGDNYTLISSITTDAFASVLSHEFLHAQYFTLPAFRGNVDEYTNSLAGQEAFTLFLKILKGTAYPRIETDWFLRNNEFLAFMLAHGMYEDCCVRRPALAGVMLKLLTHEPDDFFNEIYALWKSKNFGETGEYKELEALSKEMYKKYILPKSIDVTKSAFYKYLEEKGTPPVIVS